MAWNVKNVFKIHFKHNFYLQFHFFLQKFRYQSGLYLMVRTTFLMSQCFPFDFGFGMTYHSKNMTIDWFHKLNIMFRWNDNFQLWCPILVQLRIKVNLDTKDWAYSSLGHSSPECGWGWIVWIVSCLSFIKTSRQIKL